MRVMNKSIWPYQTRIKGDNDEAYRWCEKYFYKGGYQDPLSYYFNSSTSTWCFKNGKEFTLFCLRWSS